MENDFRPSLNQKALQAEKEIFVIGGEAAIREAMTLPQLSAIYLTRVGQEFECDRFHDPIPDDFHVSHAFLF